MLAIGNYDSHTPTLNQQYRAPVLRSACTLLAQRYAATRQPVTR